MKNSIQCCHIYCLPLKVVLYYLCRKLSGISKSLAMGINIEHIFEIPINRLFLAVLDFWLLCTGCAQTAWQDRGCDQVLWSCHSFEDWWTWPVRLQRSMKSNLHEQETLKGHQREWKRYSISSCPPWKMWLLFGHWNEVYGFHVLTCK